MTYNVFGGTLNPTLLLSSLTRRPDPVSLIGVVSAKSSKLRVLNLQQQIFHTTVTPLTRTDRN